jgi:hypothetical protein
MKMISKIFFIFFIAYNTSYALTEGKVNLDSTAFKTAFFNVSKNIGLKVSEVNGPINFQFKIEMRFFHFFKYSPKIATINDTCEYLITQRENSPLKFIFGTLNITPTLKNDSTGYSIGISPQSLEHVWLYENLIIDLVIQQNLLSKQEMQPYSNFKKSKFEYIMLNTLSPIVGHNYLNKNNPLISITSHRVSRFIHYITELTTIGLISFGLTKENYSNKFMISGISIGIITRLLGFSNFSEISDYNRLADTKYNLSKLKYFSL